MATGPRVWTAVRITGMRWKSSSSSMRNYGSRRDAAVRHRWIQLRRRDCIAVLRARFPRLYGALRTVFHALGDAASGQVDLSNPAAVVKCPVCTSENPLRVGRLPDVHVFAGHDAGEALPSSSLYRCLACGLLFRHPVLPPSAYDSLYTRTQAPCWSDATIRVDWDLVTTTSGGTPCRRQRPRLRLQ
jgi:hypothetical protein